MVEELVRILAGRRERRIAAAVGLLYALIYLAAAGVLRVSLAAAGEPWLSADIRGDWASALFRERAPFSYEPVGVVGLTPFVTLFLAVPNLLLAGFLGALVGVNAAASAVVLRKRGVKGRRGLVALIGTVPAIVAGAACCVPTFVLTLGIQVSAALTAFWPWFVPASVALLFAGLAWSLRQASS